MGKWEMVRLGDVATYVNGYAFKPSDWGNSGLQIIRIQDLTGNAYTTNYYNGQCKERYKVKDGDVLISWSASLGVYEWCKGEALLNQHIFKVVFDKIDVDKKYFMLAVNYLLEEMGKETHGSTMKHITKPRFDNTQFPLPPLDEQKRIAKNLDLASEIVKGYKEQLAELDKLVQSVFYEMFGDPVTNEKGWIRQSLLDFGSCKNGMNFGANESGIEIKYLGVGDFKELSIIEGVDSLSTISLVQTPSNEYLLRDEDIVFVRSNGNKNLVGRCVVVYPGDAALTFSGFCIRFRKSSDKLMTIYLLYVLKCASVRRLLLGRGANIQNLNQQILKQLTVPVPPISLQSQFIEMIAEIENQKSQVQRASIEAENLFNGLMQEYFE